MKKLSPHAALGQKLKELRGLRGMTQDELAERVGVFRTYMSRIETGAGNPTFSVLLALAKALNVEVAVLFEAPTLSVLPRVRSTAGASRGRVSR